MTTNEVSSQKLIYKKVIPEQKVSEICLYAYRLLCICIPPQMKAFYQQHKETIKWPFPNVKKTRIVIYPRNYIVMVSCEQQIKILVLWCYTNLICS